MADFHLQIRSLHRGAGRRAMAAAAYPAAHAEILLPPRLQESASGAWARDRSMLWQAAERVAGQRGGRLAREFQVSLPAQLSGQQRLELARAFSRQIAERYTVAIDLAVHDPAPGREPRRYHAHLLATARQVTSAGLGARTGLGMHSRERLHLGMPSESREFTEMRAQWAALTSEALREAGFDVRIRGSARSGEVSVAPSLHRRTGPRPLEEIRREAARTWLQLRVASADPTGARPVAVHDSAAQGAAAHEPAHATTDNATTGSTGTESADAQSLARDRGHDDDYLP